MEIDYYEILEISNIASTEEVIAAYRRLAKILHPDRGGSAAMFRLINEAYEVLSDDQRRAEYDHFQSSSHSLPHDESQYRTKDFVPVEEMYRRWKENRRRIACPSEESIRAGGVRELVRSSTLLFLDYTNNPRLPEMALNSEKRPPGFPYCGNCGFSTGDRTWVVPTNPTEVRPDAGPIEVRIDSGVIVREGHRWSRCTKCDSSELPLRIRCFEFQETANEAIDMRVGDFALIRPGLLSTRLTFGPVVEGRAQNEFGLRSIKVADEFSGETKSLKKWDQVIGHWKSNSLNVARFSSVRNWP